MSIEINPDLDLDSLLPEHIAKQLLQFEERKATLVTVAASIEKLEAIRQAFCSLRASGISSLLLLRKVDIPLTTEEVLAIFAFLRDWDQLLLRNLLEIASDKIPAGFLPHLVAEAKTEFKWFQEWQTAVSDPRIHRYPGLPWRSFLRKVNAENFAFAQAILRDDSGHEVLDATVKSFLIGKKKTICIFPKNWGKK